MNSVITAFTFFKQPVTNYVSKTCKQRFSVSAVYFRTKLMIVIVFVFD